MSNTGASRRERVWLTRRYRFAAGHRLYRREWDDARNEAVFGKCSNPKGHGHNYYFWVTVEAPIDPLTGFVMDLAELDRIVEEHVLRDYDHKDLNRDTQDFAETPPTGERITRCIWERLSAAIPGGLLRRVRLQETRNNLFEFEGPGEDA